MAWGDDGAVEVLRLLDVMAALRAGCPWDREQTHRSLVRYLVEEALETVEAIEAGSVDDLREELGDLLLQVVFHAQIAAEAGEFTIEDVARGVADKLVARHPYVFAGDAVPADLLASWEQRKRVEKGRASALDGIPEQLSALTRAHKVVGRARNHGLDLALPTDPITPDDLGSQLLELVARAHACDLDPEQAARAALRRLEGVIAHAEKVP